MSGQQLNLIGPVAEDYPEFVAWKALAGAGEIMRMYYAYFGFYWKRFQEKRVKVSVRLIEEKVRDEIREGRARGVKLDGYSLNSHLTKPILLHMLANHPEWRQAVEIREQRRRTQ